MATEELNTQPPAIPDQAEIPAIPDQAEMEAKVNEVFHALSTAGEGQPLIALMIGGVAFLKTIHMELLQTGADIPTELSQVVSDLSSLITPSNEQPAV